MAEQYCTYVYVILDHSHIVRKKKKNQMLMIGSRQNNTVNLALVVIKYCQQYLYHDIISKR